jgi:predicted dehydrogenase
MTTRLNVAIVGCGTIGLNHARAIARHPQLTITALVDAVPEAASSLADRVAEDADRPDEFTSLTDALSQAPVDIVVICTPSGLHVTAAEEAIAAGKHVVIEKPLDTSLARARRILELSRQAESGGLVVSVISQHRFDPASVVVAEAARSGRLGTLTSGLASVAWWRGQDYYDSGRWRGTWELDGGGAVMNQGVHTVDLLLWVLGRPVEISAQTALLAHERIEVEDIAVATIRFESGALAVLHATTAAFPGTGVRLQVHGDRGSAVIHDDQLEFFAADGDPADRAGQVVPVPDIRGNSKEEGAFVVGHLRQYEDVVEAILQHRPPGVRVQDAFESLCAVQAVYLSATSGRPVRVADVVAGDFDDAAVATGGVR